MSLYQLLQQRGLIKDNSDEIIAKKLLDEQKSYFYCGFDPTGESLTVGHLVQIVRMKLLQSFGHTPIVLIGGATGLIGDPKQTSERKLLTLEESLSNAQKIQTQLSHFFNDQAIFVNNYDWIKNIDMISFLRDYGKMFSINYMLAKDTVSKRLESGISYTEFSYMLIQAIDFLHLYEHHHCTIQFGGSDQWGNITTGLELIRKKHENSEAVGLSSPLLLKSDGTKFGKSESGTLWLDANLTSPYELYQYFLNAADADIENYFNMLTLLSKEDIEHYLKSLKEQPEKREAQKRLAEEVVLMVHGEKALSKATLVTEALFSGDFNQLDEQAFEMLTKTLKYTSNTNLMEALIEAELATSKREARQFIETSAISINGVKIQDLNMNLDHIELYFDRYAVIRRGKKKYGIYIKQ